MRPIGGELVTTITSLPIIEGHIFCISATPHLGISFPLFHGPKCSARSTSRQQQVIGLRQRIITSLHKNHSTFISVSTIFIIRPCSLYSQIYLLLFWSRVTILHLRSFIHCQCWQESNERMHSSASKKSIRNPKVRSHGEGPY